MSLENMFSEIKQTQTTNIDSICVSCLRIVRFRETEQWLLTIGRRQKWDISVLSHFSCVQLYVILWTVACHIPLSMGFSRQEYWNGVLCPFPRDLPNSRIEPMSLTSPAWAGRFFTTSTTWETPQEMGSYWLVSTEF